MAFPYKNVLLIGATAGIGKAMADRLIKAGVNVTAVGRRKDRLDAFVSKHGEGKAKSIAFDITDRAGTPKFVADVIKTSPEIDCVFLNAGVQGFYDLSKPETVDIEKYAAEMNVNFTSIVALTLAFLPFLMKKDTETGLIITGTGLAVVPAAPLSAYSASKAALSAFTLSLRDQIRDTKVKVIEIVPPVVQTELHDYMGEEKGRSMGMPVDAFTEQTYAGLAAGSDQLLVGTLGPPGVIAHDDFNAFLDKRRSIFNDLANAMRGAK